MESIKLQDLLECFFYGLNECRTVDSHGSHGLLLCVCGGWGDGQGSCMKSG